LLHDRSISVVVPAFEEALHIGRVIATMPRFVDVIYVVDDGGSDGTREAALSVGDPRVKVIRHDARKGVGAAISSGYLASLEDVVAVMAGDGQMAPEDLAAVVMPVARDQADYVKGERFWHHAVRGKMGLPRWIGGQVFSWLTSVAIGQSITDSQCGFTAISKEALATLDLPGLWPSFGYPNDILGQIAARGFRIREVPVQPIYGDETSKLKLRHLPPFFFIIGRAAVRRVQSKATRMSPGRMTRMRSTLRNAEDVSP
jgi:glycosyltransferase involved in cell wall biosynthesis